MNHKRLIILSGLVWLTIGSFLFLLGLNFLLQARNNSYLYSSESPYLLFNLLSTFLSNKDAQLLSLIVIGMVLGYVKGHYVLGKAAFQGVKRIRSFPNPTSLKNIYSFKSYLLMAVMVGIGSSMKYLNIPTDIRGLVDVAVGAALLSGALIYFKLAKIDKRESLSTRA